MSADPADPDRATFERVHAEGRVLARNPECVVAHVAPFLLATRCDGAVLDVAIRRVAAFALVLSSILVVVVATRAAPLPIVAVPAVWGGGALGAVAWVVRRRRRLGTFLLDFEGERVVRWPPTGAASASIVRRWTADARVVVGDAPHDDALRWIELSPGDAGISLRIARVDAEGARAVTRLFRTYRVRCAEAQRSGAESSG